jgi:hypothetical protein
MTDAFHMWVDRLHKGEFGDVKSTTVWYAGPIDAVGSHVIDLMYYLFFQA